MLIYLDLSGQSELSILRKVIHQVNNYLEVLKTLVVLHFNRNSKIINAKKQINEMHKYINIYIAINYTIQWS